MEKGNEAMAETIAEGISLMFTILSNGKGLTFEECKAVLLHAVGNASLIEGGIDIKVAFPRSAHERQ